MLRSAPHLPMSPPQPPPPPVAASAPDPSVPAWLRGLPRALEYRPTKSEFADPIAFLSRVEREAAAYGVCKGFLLYDLVFWEILGRWWGGSGHAFVWNLGFDTQYTQYSQLDRLLHRYGSIDHFDMESDRWNGSCWLAAVISFGCSSC